MCLKAIGSTIWINHFYYCLAIIYLVEDELFTLIRKR